jgi:EmrB/QacA subfamily drug resistance transporter
LATAGVLGGTFLAAIETTVVAAAMPTVADQLGGLTYYSWVFSAYLLTSTVSIPLWGKLSDLYGRRRLYLWCVGLFLVGSALSGWSQTMPQLILFRALQGFGAGGLLPLGMSVLADLYTLEERGRMQGLLSGVWGVASIVGPVTGGYITELFSWRWVFFLNIPFGIATAVAVGTALRDRASGDRRPVDYAGAALLMTSVTLLVLALSRSGVETGAGGDGWVVPTYAAAVGFGILLFRVERRAAEPMVPLDLLSTPMVAAIAGTGLLVGVAMFGAISYVPLFVQEGLGGNAVEAGRALTPLILGWVVMSVVTGRVVVWTGYRPLVLAGMTCVTAAFLGLTRIGAQSSVWLLRGDLALMGMGMGMTMLSLVLAMQNVVERRHLGVATSFGQFTRSIGGAVGVALLGAIIAGALPAGGDPTAAEMTDAIHRGFWLATFASGLAVVSATRIPSGLPADLVHPEQAAARAVIEDDGVAVVVPKADREPAA